MLATASRIPICDSLALGRAVRLWPACSGRCGRPLISDVAVEAEMPLCTHMSPCGLYDFDFARTYGLYTGAMVRAVAASSNITRCCRWEIGLPRAFRELCSAAPGYLRCRCGGAGPQWMAARLPRARLPIEAELIARPLARRLGIPFRAALLVRVRPRPQKLRLTLRECKLGALQGALTLSVKARELTTFGSCW